MGEQSQDLISYPANCVADTAGPHPLSSHHSLACFSFLQARNAWVLVSPGAALNPWWTGVGRETPQLPKAGGDNSEVQSLSLDYALESPGEFKMLWGPDFCYPGILNNRSSRSSPGESIVQQSLRIAATQSPRSPQQDWAPVAHRANLFMITRCSGFLPFPVSLVHSLTSASGDHLPNKLLTLVSGSASRALNLRQAERGSLLLKLAVY